MLKPLPENYERALAEQDVQQKVGGSTAGAKQKVGLSTGSWDSWGHKLKHKQSSQLSSYY